MFLCGVLNFYESGCQINLKAHDNIAYCGGITQTTMRILINWTTYEIKKIKSSCLRKIYEVLDARQLYFLKCSLLARQI